MRSEPAAEPRNQRAAVLYPARARERVDIGRGVVPEDLTELIDYSWWVRWDASEPHVQPVIPRPVVHLAVEEVAGRSRVLVHGVHQRMFERRLEGRGATVAVAFRPAGFRPFVSGPVGALRGRELPAAQVFGVPDEAVAEQALAAATPEDGAGVLFDWLRAIGWEADPKVSQLAELVARVERDPDLTRAEQLADLAGVGLRTLQRQFVEYVGVGPKWVVQRSRLLDVAEAANSGREVDWASLAATLGYADQPHLIRSFTALVGCPPAAYAARA
jgi:AraC-like DNA-binding protein